MNKTGLLKKLLYHTFLSILLAIILFFPEIAGAQPPPASIDQATKEVDRDVREKVDQALYQPPKKPPKIEEEIEPASVEGPTFLIEKINLVGVQSFEPEDFSHIIEKYENKEVALSQLKVLAKEIEREYLRKGVIAACFVPPQQIKDGVVVLRVIEAKMGDLTVKRHHFFWNERVRYYWNIAPGEVLNYNKISRALQFMNKNPDRQVKATLHAGKKPETTDVHLDVKSYFPLHLTATLDNEGAPSTGKIRKGMGFVENNMIGLDDTFLCGYTGGKNFGGVYAFHRVPITNYGTTVLYGFSRTKAFPKKDFTLWEYSSTSTNMSMFVHQDLFHKDEYKGEISFGVDSKDKNTTARFGTVNADRLRIVRVAGNFIERGFRNVTTFRPEFSQGLNMFGARRESNLSSRHAKNTFFKYYMNTTFTQVLAKNIRARATFTGQFAAEKLTPQEQLYMGGINSVRGYPSGDFLADSGFTSNMELQIPAFFLPDKLKIPYGERPLKDEITGVMFFDCGYGTKRGKIQGEKETMRMASLGAGLRINLLNQALLRLEWGFPLQPVVDGPQSEWSRQRLHVALSFQDHLPREVERLQKIQKEEYRKEQAWSILNKELRNSDSPLSQKMRYYLYMARKSLDEENYQEAKKYYAKIYSMGNAAYMRTETYIIESEKHVGVLKAEREKAFEYYSNGEYEKAKELWQKIKKNAKIKPLTIDVL